jgi:hypothetical protein
MKNRMAVAQRSAGRLSNAEHGYQPRSINQRATAARKTPADAWTLAWSADELFPSDSAGPDLMGRPGAKRRPDRPLSPVGQVLTETDPMTGAGRLHASAGRGRPVDNRATLRWQVESDIACTPVPTSCRMSCTPRHVWTRFSSVN